MRLKLFPKIALVLTLLATLPVAIVGWQTYSLNKTHLENTIFVIHTNLANSLSDRIENYLKGLTGKVRTAIEPSRVHGFFPAETLQQFLISNKEFISIALINPQGEEKLKVVHPNHNDEKNLKDRSAETAFLSYQSQETVSDETGAQQFFGFSFVKNDPQLSIVLPFDPKNYWRGAFYIVVSLAELWTEIATEGAGILPADLAAFVVDKNGIVIAHSQKPELVVERATFAKHPIVAEALLGQTIGSKEYADEKGELVIGAYSRIPLTRWMSVIEQSKESAFLPVYETQKSALIIVLASLGIASLIAFVFAKNLSRPIFSLIAGAQKVARGEFDYTVQVKSKDEMSDLAGTFNEMARELKRYSELQVDRIIEEKTKTESVIFSIADGIVLTDQEGNIQLLNDRAVRIFNLGRTKPDAPATAGSAGGENAASSSTEAEFLGKNLFQLLPAPDISKALKELLSHPESNIFKEITITNETYEQHYQLSSELVYTPRTARKLGVVTVVHDVTLERQMDQLKEGFLHSITHDLRNPLTSIMGFMKFLLDGTAGPINAQQTQMLQTMDRASARLLSMINDILDIAKIEAGKLEIELGPIAVANLIEDVRVLYLPLAEKKTIRLETVVPPDSSVGILTVQGDSNQLERVIGNLVANAIKFTPTGGNITMQLDDFPDRVQFTVADTGAGIPEDYREKIFDKFQQIRGQKRGGTGLGLTICKYFVELHLGRIWVESEEEKGSRFIFWIPKGLSRSTEGEVVRDKVIEAAHEK